MNVCKGLLAGCCLLWAWSGQAEVYRWVDETGRVHYGDQPKGEQSYKIKPPSGKSDTPPDQRQRMEKTRRLLNAYQAERQQEREQKAKAKEEAEKRHRSCIEARDNLRQYTDIGNIYRLDKEGNRQYLSEHERKQGIQRAREAVAHWCG